MLRKAVVVSLVFLVLFSVLVFLFAPEWDDGTIDEGGLLTESDVREACTSYCDEVRETEQSDQKLVAKLEYCTRRFSLDVDGDGIPTSLVGDGYNSYCEDGVHCFNVHSCETGAGELNASTCKEAFIDYYTGIANRTREEALNKTGNWYVRDGEDDRSVGSCDLENTSEENWYTENFADINASKDS